MRAIRLGVLYFAPVFAAGFVLGALRQLVLAPRIGALAAVLAELPVMLTAAWALCGWLLRDGALDRRGALVMGGVAFLCLLTAETLLALALGVPFAAYLSGFRQAPQVAGLAGQLVFALLPLLRAGQSRSGSV